MRTMTARRCVAAAGIGAAALVITACGSSGASSAPSAPSKSSPGSTSGTSASRSEVSSPAPSSTGTGSDSSVPTQSALRSHGQVTGSECATSQLKAVAEKGGVAAGSIYFRLVFTNVSPKTCTLAGYPGVSYVTRMGGVQVGSPAQRDSGTPVITVTLRPGGTASAVVSDSNGAGGYDPNQCRLTPVEGFRVYPPDQKAALFVTNRTQHCADMDINPLHVQVVRN